MKTFKTTIIALFVTLLSTGAFAQQPVKEKHLLGNWKLIIDIEDELEEAEREAEDEDNLLGEITLKWVSGLVTGLLDEVEIYMEFRGDGELKVTVDAFGEREVEYATWHIDRDGKLYIDDTDSYASDDDDYWMYEDGLLISYENEKKRSRKNNIYLVNIDKN